jgi:uncharacterized repeat protein (TIGR03803 family)
MTLTTACKNTLTLGSEVRQPESPRSHKSEFMNEKRFPAAGLFPFPALVMLILLLGAAFVQPSLYAQTETVLYSFTGASGDGIGPAASLIMDSKGNLYGTTQFGGSSTNCPRGCGTVFKLDTAGKETVLYSFTGTPDGANPVSGLIMDPSGTLYGTTVNGGSAGLGTVFKIDATNHETILHSFAGGSTDGANPTDGNLLMDSSGNLYGVTLAGGSTLTTCLFGGSCGTVFKIDPTGTETILHTFTNSGSDGGNPSGSLIMDSAGNLYGTTQAGGGTLGGGTVYKLDNSGVETILITFSVLSPNPAGPSAGVIMDSRGDLFGTTQNGGIANDGVVFELTPSDTLAFSTSLVISPTNGGVTSAGLVLDKKGSVYGTTQQGGSCNIFTGAFVGCGVVFKVDKSGNETIVHNFSGLDGSNPLGGLIMDKKGNLYGTTSQGGAGYPTGCSCGTIFKITPK